MGISWIIVFLGNPGTRYTLTRHNAGFMASDALTREKGIKIDRLRFRALTAQCEIGGASAFLMKPQTYMNLSGEATAPAAAFYKVPPERVLVVSDDVTLPEGRLRIRKNGSAGGHNGLKSIIESLGTADFPRIKIGVGSPSDPRHELYDWVTGTMTEKELTVINKAATAAAEAVETYIEFGAEAAMNKFNQWRSE